MVSDPCCDMLRVNISSLYYILRTLWIPQKSPAKIPCKIPTFKSGKMENFRVKSGLLIGEVRQSSLDSPEDGVLLPLGACRLAQVGRNKSELKVEKWGNSGSRPVYLLAEGPQSSLRSFDWPEGGVQLMRGSVSCKVSSFHFFPLLFLISLFTLTFSSSPPSTVLDL